MSSADFRPSQSCSNEASGDAEVDSASIRAGNVRARWFSPVSDDASADVDAPETPKSAARPSNSPYSLNFDAPNAFEVDSPYSFCAPRSPKSSASVVECELCARRCRIAPGKTGFCSARRNDDGALRARFYGRPASLAIDPIEKKPLYHFLPGTPVLSLGTFGCNLACRFCQNWQISRGLPIGETVRRVVEPAEIVDAAVARGCPSVAFTYNEPTIWAEFVVDVAKRCRQAGIKTVAVTNGTIVGRAREEFFGAIDAANIDLKAFSAEFYRDLTRGSLDAVKETLRFVAKNTNVWLEVTNLLIPTKNDSPDELARLADWVAETLGTDVPLHFSAFFPTYCLTDVPATPPETLVAAENIARKSGIRYVYRGNVDDDSGQTTRCPRCGAPLIARSRYATRVLPTLTRVSAANSASANDRFQRFCEKCGEGVPGIFDESVFT